MYVFNKPAGRGEGGNASHSLPEDVHLYQTGNFPLPQPAVAASEGLRAGSASGRRTGVAGSPASWRPHTLSSLQVSRPHAHTLLEAAWAVWGGGATSIPEALRSPPFPARSRFLLAKKRFALEETLDSFRGTWSFSTRDAIRCGALLGRPFSS